MSTPELLAPAGSLLSVYAAVQSGADAIYLGVGTWNARARAENLSLTDLEKSIRYCYPRGVRIYLTMNTLLRDEELPVASDLIASAYEMGIHAVIVQDIGLLKRIRERFPRLPVHASTQMNLYRADAYEQAKNVGISRVILPRELSIDQIRARVKAGEKVGVETEVFIHGALCNSFSGLCLFSAMNGSGERSGNRGRCAQPCREEYSLIGSDGSVLRTGRIFSLRDQSALTHLGELIRSNVHSLKIEGRMKDPDYVKIVVRVYRNLIDILSSGAECTPESTDRMTAALLLAFNRGGSFTAGYMAQKRFTLPAGNFSGKFGVNIGEIRKICPRSGTMDIAAIESFLPKPKDILSIRANSREEASFPIGKVSFENGSYSIKGLHPDSLSRLKPGMSVYCTRADDPDGLFDEKCEGNKTPVTLRIEKDRDNEHRIKASVFVEDLFGQSYRSSSLYDLPDPYSGSILEKDRVEAQLSRSGDTPFRVGCITLPDDIDLRVPVSFVNSIRRDMLNRIEQDIQSSRMRIISESGMPIHLEKPESESSAGFQEPVVESKILSTESSFETSPAVAVEYLSLALSPEPIFADSEYCIFSVYDIAQDDCLKRVEKLIRVNSKAGIYIRVPGSCADPQSDWVDSTIRSFSERFPESFRGIITSDRFSGNFPFILSNQANIHNSAALIEVGHNQPAGFYLSEELTNEDLIQVISKAKSFAEKSTLFIYRYGPIEWMQSMFCPLGNNIEGCVACKDHPLVMLQTKHSSEKKRESEPCFILLHPEFCVSELFGPRRHIRTRETVDLLKTMKIDMIQTVRILTEPANRIFDIVSAVRKPL